jgi:hypothetical protein
MASVLLYPLIGLLIARSPKGATEAETAPAAEPS